MTVVSETQQVGVRNSAQRHIATADTIVEAVAADAAKDQCREVTNNFPSLSKRVLMVLHPGSTSPNCVIITVQFLLTFLGRCKGLEERCN
jgi:hypothetical protein